MGTRGDGLTDRCSLLAHFMARLPAGDLLHLAECAPTPAVRATWHHCSRQLERVPSHFPEVSDKWDILEITQLFLGSRYAAQCIPELAGVAGLLHLGVGQPAPGLASSYRAMWRVIESAEVSYPAPECSCLLDAISLLSRRGRDHQMFLMARSVVLGRAAVADLQMLRCTLEREPRASTLRVSEYALPVSSEWSAALEALVGDDGGLAATRALYSGLV